MPDRPPPRSVVRAVIRLRQALLRAADLVVPAELAAFEHSMGLACTALLGAMAELGVADALGAGPRTAEQLAGALGLDADALHRVLRGLAVHGIVRLDRRGRFRLTRLGRTLRSDRPLSLDPWVRYLNLRSTREAWAALPEAVSTGEPPFPRVNGRSVWEHFAAHPEEERLFASSMRNVSHFDLPAIVAGYPWPEQGRVCDVAGGTGAVLASILGARPALRGVLVDAPGVLTEAEEELARRGVRDRVELVAGDIFEGIEAAADVYVLKDVLHDWDDAACTRVLATVRRAMPPGARIVVVERLLERDEVEPVTAIVDLQMLTQTDGGRQRSGAELRALLRAAGLMPGPVHQTSGPALVEGIAAAT